MVVIQGVPARFTQEYNKNLKLARKAKIVAVSLKLRTVNDAAKCQSELAKEITVADFKGIEMLRS